MTLQRFEIASRRDLALAIVTAIDVALRTDALAEVEVAMPSGLVKVISVKPDDAFAAIAVYIDLRFAELRELGLSRSRPLTRKERALLRVRLRKLPESFSWVRTAKGSVRLLPLNTAYEPCDKPPVWLELPCGPEGMAVWADLIRFQPGSCGNELNHGTARIRHSLDPGCRGYFATLAMIAKRCEELSKPSSTSV